jgi:hypothetical protein
LHKTQQFERIETMSDTRHITVYTGEQYDTGFPPEPLEEFRAWLDAQVASIPEEYRGTATIQFDNRTFYDSTYATVEISYSRPATADELKADAEAELARRQSLEAKERATLEALKKRYPDHA